MTVNEVCQIKIELSNGDVDVIGINTEARLGAFGILLKSLAVSTFKRDRFEQNHHNEIEPPNLETNSVESQLISKLFKQQTLSACRRQSIRRIFPF